MKEDLLEIKNRIINKIITITLIFAFPTIIAIIYHWVVLGWNPLFWVTLIYDGVLLYLFLFRKKLKFEVKLHLHSAVFLILGISVLYYDRFSGVFYFCFIPILLNGILLGRRSAAIYLLIVSIAYFFIAIGYITGKIGAAIDNIYQINDTFTWIAFFMGTLFILILILLATTELYKYFINVIQYKNELTEQLKKHQEDLEFLVKERTEELEVTNEELKAINEELNDKSQIINNQNSELKATLQHLKETQAQLIHTEKMASLGILTAGVAHEINNPLNYINGAYEGLMQKCTKVKEKKKILQLLGTIKSCVDRASEIVKSLNQFSRKSQNSNEICQLHAILDNCLTMLHNQLKNKVEIEKNYYKTEIIIEGNVGNLHQVFLNILLNAEQAILEEGKISIKTYIKGNTANIEISDTGMGIAEEELSFITDPFYTTKAPGEGTGLGLTVTYNIIKDHKGSLEFTSKLNKGTTVRMVLPLKAK